MNAHASCLAALAAGVLVLAGCQTTGSPYAKAQNEGWKHYGQEPQRVGDYVALGAIAGDEQGIVVDGLVTETCETSGCWAKIVDGDGNEIIVITEEKQFHLPRNCTGHRAVAHGNVQVRVISVEEQRHWAEVSGASPEAVAAITEPDRKLLLIADSVYLDGDGFVAAYTEEEAKAACEAALEKEMMGGESD
jgi:hypothetical protein